MTGILHTCSAYYPSTAHVQGPGRYTLGSLVLVFMFAFQKMPQDTQYGVGTYDIRTRNSVPQTACNSLRRIADKEQDSSYLRHTLVLSIFIFPKVQLYLDANTGQRLPSINFSLQSPRPLSCLHFQVASSPISPFRDYPSYILYQLCRQFSLEIPQCHRLFCKVRGTEHRVQIQYKSCRDMHHPLTTEDHTLRQLCTPCPCS